MADVDLYGVGDDPTHPAASSNYDHVLRSWERDIVRASQFRARNRGLDDDDADELAQAARLRVWGALRKLGNAAGEHYLRKVIANAVRTPVRNDPALEGAREVDEADAVETGLQLPDTFARDAVRGWVSTLSKQLQDVYRLLFLEEYTQREAALVLGVSQPRIAQLHRNLLERATRELKSLAS